MTSLPEVRRNKLYTLGEEIANAVIHGIGTLLGIAACVLLIVAAAKSGSAMKVVCASIYGASLIILFLMSTLYHALSPEGAKKVFRKFDHATIFLLIAGSYTPIVLCSIGGALGWVMFGLVWTLAIIGIVFNAISVEKFKVFSMVTYIFMGWCVVFIAKPTIQSLDPKGLLLLFLGGLAYTFGLIFYKMKDKKYMHTVWHVFVLAGAILQYFCIQLYVVA